MIPEPPERIGRHRPSMGMRRSVLGSPDDLPPPLAGPIRSVPRLPEHDSDDPPDRATDAGPRRRRRVGHPRGSRGGTAAFALSLVLLVAAVPTLGLIGINMIRDSRAGRFDSRVTDPTAPGYEALVEPTPIALLVQKDAAGKPVGLTVLALGGGNGGGSVLLLPLNTQVERVTFGLARIGDAYASGGDQGLAGQVGGLLRTGFSDVIDLDDQKWAALTTPVAPIRFDNPDRISTRRLVLPAGPVALSPQQVGPYLAARNEGESELTRLNRQQTFWQAWIDLLARSRDRQVVPGETASGIGLYVRTLARGPLTFEPLPFTATGRPADVADEHFVVDVAKLRAQVAAMVPFPTAPAPGFRVTVRLLNGVNGRPIPRSLERNLVLRGAAISTIGNDAHFRRKLTVLAYRDPSLRNQVLAMRAALRGRGRLKLDPESPDTADVSIVLGSDVISPTGREVTTGG